MSPLPRTPRRPALRHPHEADRLESLRSYRLLDTPAEAIYDRLALMAARTCAAPMAAIALADEDRVWFKARVGIPRPQVVRANTFCDEVVVRGAPMTVTDARQVTSYSTAVDDGLLAYAGVPLVGRDGLPVGTLCVFDTVPRAFSAASLEWLELLAEQVVAHMELRRLDRRAGLPSPSDPTAVVRPGRLRSALDRGEVRPWFQPVVDLASGERRGAEALMRWVHPELGLLAPSTFLPLLEATGLILPAGREVARRALEVLRRSYDVGLTGRDFGIAINASAYEVSEPGFAASLLDMIQRAELPANVVTVELTETAPVTSLDVMRCELEQLRAAGLRIDADDFGSGQSTLQRLLDLPLTGIKLDLGLISRVPHDERVARVVTWLVHGAHDLGLTVVAEGVETETQRAFLRGIGCDRAQGYLFGRPAADLVA
jgi:EAL domain-containing protein (putative c-di-GMP-specific phosphodiesterase class I)